jgi:hypothetical protein
MNHESIDMIAGNSFSELLQGPAGRGMGRDEQCRMRRLPTSKTTNTYSTRNPAVIATKKSAVTMALA